MSDWKQQAKKLIGKAELGSAIVVMQKNGIKTGSLASQVFELERESEEHVKNKTQFTSSEYEKHSAKFSEIAWALLQKINGTNEPMPEYLK